MQSVGGKFHVSFLLTKAWYRRKFPSAFSSKMQYVARKFHRHCTNCWRIWVEQYVNIFLITDAQCLQKKIPAASSILMQNIDGNATSVCSPMQNVGADYRSTCGVIYQAWDVVFHHQMKHREESWQYHAQRSVSDALRCVSSGDETLGRMLDITSQTKWF